MFRNGEDVEYVSTLDEIPLKQITGSKKIRHTYGTSYTVKMDAKGYEWIKTNLVKKLQYWFNSALLSKKIELKVNGKTLEPYIPKGELITKKIKYKNQSIMCHIVISKEDIPEESRHIVYSVFGKRIKNQNVEWAYQIRGEQSKRVCCLADVSVLANQIITNKEYFHKNPATNKIKSLVNQTFLHELDDKDMIIKHDDISSRTNVVFNELTKRLDKVLQSPELKFLNPFSNPRTHDVIVKNEDGDVNVGEVTGKQATTGNNIENVDGGKNGELSSGNEIGDAYYEKEEGIKLGTKKTKKTSGIHIIVEDFPKDNREGWVDPINKAIVFNAGHSFAKSIETNPSLRDYNLTRVVISSLIKSTNDQKEMDAVTTLNYFEETLHKVWL